MFQFIQRQGSKQNPCGGRVYRQGILPVALPDRGSPSVSLSPAGELILRGDKGASRVSISFLDTKIKVVADGKQFSFDSDHVNAIRFEDPTDSDVFTSGSEEFDDFDAIYEDPFLPIGEQP